MSEHNGNRQPDQQTILRYFDDLFSRVSNLEQIYVVPVVAIRSRAYIGFQLK